MVLKELEIGEAKVAVAHEAEEFLGRVILYGVQNRLYSREDFEERLEKAGVPAGMRPQPPRPADAFKAAVRDCESNEYLVDYEHYDDPSSGKRAKDPHVMLVVQRLHDVAKDALPVAMKVAFDSKRQTIALYGSPSIDQATENKLASDIQSRYAAYRDSYRSEHVRRMIHDTLYRAKAFPVKASGGVYFVPEDHAAEMDAIARFVDELPGAEMVSLPVVDREPERKTVLKRYEKATFERIEALMLQVRDVVQKGEPIVPSAFARVVDELSYLREQKEKYAQLLNVSMGKVDVELQILEVEAQKLAGLVKSK